MVCLRYSPHPAAKMQSMSKPEAQAREVCRVNRREAGQMNSLTLARASGLWLIGRDNHISLYLGGQARTISGCVDKLANLTGGKALFV